MPSTVSSPNVGVGSGADRQADLSAQGQPATPLATYSVNSGPDGGSVLYRYVPVIQGARGALTDHGTPIITSDALITAKTT